MALEYSTIRSNDGKKVTTGKVFEIGGMSQILNASLQGKEVVVKVQKKTGKKESETRFAREAEISRMVSGLRNFLKFYCKGTEGEHDFIVLEKGGRSLKDELKTKDFYNGDYIQKGCRIGLELCNALTYIHRMGITHRDVKPGNVLIGKNVKLIDFGIAKFPYAHQGINRIGSNYNLVHATGEFEGIGTPEYMSPEQFEKRTIITPKSDIFSLGVLLYETLSSNYGIDSPFYADDVFLIKRNILNCKPTPLHKKNPNIPEDLSRIIHKCLEKDKNNRFSSTNELNEALKRYAN